MVTTLFPKPSAKEPIIFHNDFVSYGDITIRYEDATSLTFHSLRLYGTVNSFDGFVDIRSWNARIKLKIRNSSWLGLEPSMKNRYEEICSEAFRYCARPIADKLMAEFHRGNPVRVGSITFDRTGLTDERPFRSRRRATWDLHPEVRSTGSGFLLSSVSGIIEVSYFYPGTGKMVVVATTSSRVENGCVVPELLRRINSWYDTQKT